MPEHDESYSPADPTKVESSDEAIRFWSRTLEVEEDRLREAVKKAGPMLEDVKKELGIAGV